MKALITGATSGIGKEFAIKLSNMGYELILVSRDETKLKLLKNQLKTKIKIMSFDLSDMKNCNELYNKLQNENIDLLINNAGFGMFGDFASLELEKEMNMIDLNIKAVHRLTKLFIKDMIQKNSGKILNVASIAGTMPAGPLMATYYATKAYVLSLSLGINEELIKKKSKVRVCTLCPGPVDTNFNCVAGVKFNIKPLSAEYVVSYAIKKLNKNKEIIIPGILSKFIYIGSKLIPDRILVKCAYRAQIKKKC